MGRELKRVPLNFNYPLHQVWKGYINPYHSLECKSCGSSGLNEATKKLSDAWYAFDNPRYISLDNGRQYNDAAWSNHLTEIEIKALIKHGRLFDFTRVPINEKQKKIIEENGGGWLPYNNGYIPTPDEVNRWNRETMGHDGINQWICVKARAKHLGIYGTCKFCKGTGEIWQSNKIKKLHENWKDFEPPKGRGYQLWETTSEGSPVSPVFKTLDELCEWCENNSTTFAHFRATKNEWKEMLDKDFVVHKEGNAIFI